GSRISRTLDLSAIGVECQTGRVSCCLMVLAQAGHKETKQGLRAGVAKCFGFSIQLRAVPAASLPPLENVGFVGVKQTFSIREFASLRKRLRREKPMHRVA